MQVIINLIQTNVKDPHSCSTKENDNHALAIVGFIHITTCGCLPNNKEP